MRAFAPHRAAPRHRLPPTHHLTAPHLTAQLVLSLLNSEEQLREAFTYLYAHGKNIDTWIEIREAIWHWVIVRVDNWALVVTSLVACVELLASDDPAATMVEDRIRIMFSLSALFAWLQFFSARRTCTCDMRVAWRVCIYGTTADACTQRSAA